MTGLRIDYHKHCQLEFGEYVQTHEHHNNSMEPRTIGAIALRPTGNIQGGHYFFNLLTGKVIKRHNWTRMPMPSEVINRIHSLAKDGDGERQNVEELILPTEPGALFNPLDFDNNINHIDDYIQDPQNDAGFDNTANNNDIGLLNNQNEAEEEEHIGDFLPEDDEAIIINPDVNEINDNDELDVINDDEGELHELVEDGDLGTEMDRRYGPRTLAYNLRPRQPRDYSHLFTTISHNILTQYTFKKGIEVFGQEGVAAVVNELKQLHDR
jgi:hypothetical protein